MTTMFVEISDYAGFYEDIQGNVNASGLVYEHDIDEAFEVYQSVYTVWTDQIDDGFTVTPDFNPYHHLLLTETLAVQETMGNIPIEVYKTNINVIHAREAAPVRVWWFGVNVVHGADTYFEEVYSNAHMRSTYVNAVPYHFRHIYESINFEFNNIQPLPGVYKSLYMQTGDLINFRHSVFRQYYFNNLAKDHFFAYDIPALAWKHDLGDDFVITADTVGDIAIAVHDIFWSQDTNMSSWIGSQTVTSNCFQWDKAESVRAFSHILAEAVALDPGAWAVFQEILSDSLGIAVDLSKTIGKTTLSVSEASKLSDAPDIIKFVIGLIEETFAGTPALTGIVAGKHTIADGAAVTDSSSENITTMGAILETLSVEDINLVRWIFAFMICDGVETVDSVIQRAVAVNVRDGFKIAGTPLDIRKAIEELLCGLSVEDSPLGKMALNLSLMEDSIGFDDIVVTV